MAQERITDLPLATIVNGTDVVPIVQGGVTKQAHASLLSGSTVVGLHRYWSLRQLVGTDIGGNIFVGFARINKIEFRATTGGAAQTQVTAAVGSAYSSGYDASKLIDNNNATFWNSNHSPLFEEWVKFDMGSAVAVREIALYPSIDISSEPTQAIGGFGFYYSDDDATYTYVGTYLNSAAYASATAPKIFEIPA